MKFGTRAALAAAALALLLPLPAHADGPLPVGNPMSRGAQMLDLNLGYGLWLEDGAPDGSFGFGLGYQYFLGRALSVGFDVSADRLGEFRDETAAEPVNLELIGALGQVGVHLPGRVLAPYVAVGSGPYFLRSSVVGESQLDSHWGVMGRAGVRFVGVRPVMGLDARYQRVFLDERAPADLASGQSNTEFAAFKFTVAWVF